MPIVERIRWRPFRVPFTAEFRASYGTLAFREGLLVELQVEEGQVGLGEASPLPLYSGGSLDECRRLVRWLAGSLIGRDVADAWDLPAAYRNVSPGSIGPALAGLQCAAGDVEARARGIALAQVLAERLDGGSPTDAPMVEVNGLIGDGDPAEAGTDAGRLAAAGFRTVKVKVGSDHAGDLARVAAIRAAVGPAVRIRLDANGALTEEQARRRLDDYRAFQIEMVEQPVAAGASAWHTMARLRRPNGPRLAADESIRGLSDFEALRAAEATLAGRGGGAPARIVDAVVVKPMLLGLGASLAVIRGCSDEPALDVIVTTTFDAGVGVSMALHVARAVPPARRLAAGLDTLRFLDHSLVLPPDAGVTGPLAEPRGPGIGVEIDRAAVARYATGPWEEGEP